MVMDGSVIVVLHYCAVPKSCRRSSSSSRFTFNIYQYFFKSAVAADSCSCKYSSHFSLSEFFFNVTICFIVFRFFKIFNFDSKFLISKILILENYETTCYTGQPKYPLHCYIVALIFINGKRYVTKYYMVGCHWLVRDTYTVFRDYICKYGTACCCSGRRIYNILTL